MVLVFLGAVVLANLSVAYFGPISTPINAFLLIGLDLTSRDRLHDRWEGRSLKLRMVALILAGTGLTWLLNRSAGHVALASMVAFAASTAVDTAVYHASKGMPWVHRVLRSNVASAAVDSVLFPILAFGGFPWMIILAQFVAKVLGGYVWAWILARRKA